MIITKLMGGLGNQMFQYAAARGLAELRGTKVVLDLSWFDNVADVDTPRFYELERFNLSQKKINPARLTLMEARTDSLKGRIFDATKGLVSPRVILRREKGHGFDPSVAQLPDNTLLEGYWQSEKYFKPIRPLILEAFEFREPMNQKNEEVLKKIDSTAAVSLHVRRGDYVNNAAANAFHGLTGLDYYQEAVKQLVKQVPSPTFFVFSDDPEWCQANLKLKQPTMYVTHNTAGSEDMRLMKHCQHHIIANSTFSWWGAWLNPSLDKIVYAPKRWFNDASMDTKDILPPEWNQL